MTLKKTVSNKKVIAKRMGDIETDVLVDELTPDNRIVGLTNGMFSLISLIHSCLKKTGKADVTISTWSAGWYDIQVMDDLINSELINEIKLIIDRSFKTRQAGYSVGVTEIFKPENIRTTNTHSKFVLISNDTWKICILSSMNLNENKRCENFDINTDCEVFNLFNNFSTELFKIQQPGIIESRKIIDNNFDNLFESDTSGWGVKTEW